MNSTSNTPKDHNEIDLTEVAKITKGYYDSTLSKIYRGILFLKRNAFILGALLIVSIAYGYYKDTKVQTFEHHLIVRPNFSSVDHLYDNIALLNTNIRNNESSFFENIGIQTPKKLHKIEIEPIVDLYPFIQEHKDHYSVFKLLVDNGALNKVLEDPTTAKHFYYHKIILTTNGKYDAETLTHPLLNFLNESEYFNTYKIDYVASLEKRVAGNDSIVKQVDAVIDAFKSTVNDGAAKNDKLVYYNENSQLNDLLETKERILEDQVKLKASLLHHDKIIREISSTLNLNPKPNIFAIKKIMYPLEAFILFLIIISFLRFYKKQKLKYS
jgi:hypothetical protein